MTEVSGDPTAIDIKFDPREQRMQGIAVHGNTPFDVPFISKIGHNLWQGGCENGLILPRHIKHVVSLYRWESYRVEHELQSSLTVEMYDSINQGMDQVNLLAEWVNLCRKQGAVLVHCQAGLNRSSLVAARALTLEGKSGAEAIAQIRGARSPACLCNPAFENYIRQELWEAGS